MSERQDMQNQAEQEIPTRTEQETFLRPPVTVYEDAGGITLKADLPGVSRDRLDIRVDRNTLTIEAEVGIDMPEGMEALYADVNITRFRRSFTLSNELEAERISAEMKDGVLTLTLPKRAELQPRRIEVNTG
ncbi:MAG: Hsp20/alpha crystallin family protein [Candidatus Competibacterales bacterium]|nr:Hsp20/alpha crystallin family protein [Candidatus Competibacterales bacterium]